MFIRITAIGLLACMAVTVTIYSFDGRVSSSDTTGRTSADIRKTLKAFWEAALKGDWKTLESLSAHDEGAATGGCKGLEPEGPFRLKADEVTDQDCSKKASKDSSDSMPENVRLFASYIEVSQLKFSSVTLQIVEETEADAIVALGVPYSGTLKSEDDRSVKLLYLRRIYTTWKVVGVASSELAPPTRKRNPTLNN